MPDPLEKLCGLIGYTFQDKTLLKRALTHRSVSSNNYERLEFLGDAILNLVISEELFSSFSDENEGMLSRMRSHIVRGETLTIVAANYSLGDYLVLGPGELKSGGFRRDSILADSLEAIIGAVYLDSDFETSRDFILRLFGEQIDSVSPDISLKDPKTRLQEYLQARKQSLPSYQVVETTGEQHKKLFTVECFVEGLSEPTVGKGRSRRRAEQQSAKKAYEILTSHGK